MQSASSANEAPRSRDRRAFVVVVVLLVAAMAAPSATLLIAWERTDESDAPDEAALTYSPGSSARTVTIAATGRAQWRDATAAYAPAWTGLVTDVLVKRGDDLGDGTPVARVNDIEIRHFGLDTPLYQPVCAGDTILVEEVREVLQRSDLSVGSGPALSSTDLTSIRQYAAQIGVSDTVSCFSAGWIVVTTEPVGPLAEIHLQVGRQAPALGEIILLSKPTLAGLDVSGTSGAPTIDGLLDKERASLFADTELVIGGRPTGVGLADLADPASLDALATSLNPKVKSTDLAVNLALRETQYVVPATSVVAALDELSCVEAASDGRTIQVRVVASSVSGLIVDFADAADVGPIRSRPQNPTCA
jgi:hypothetical protein